MRPFRQRKKSHAQTPALPSSLAEHRWWPELTLLDQRVQSSVMIARVI
jgi:hypothetical protein